MAGYLKELVSQSALELKFGLVQTAYANGSSTDYINNKLVCPGGLSVYIYLSVFVTTIGWNNIVI